MIGLGKRDDEENERCRKGRGKKGKDARRLLLGKRPSMVILLVHTTLIGQYIDVYIKYTCIY